MTDTLPNDPIERTLTAPAWKDRLGTIVHIGAGAGAYVATCLETAARHIHLVDALPANRARLERHAAGSSRLHLVYGAVTDQDGTAQLNLYKPAAMSSLRTATGLKDLFPGLSLVDRCAVPAFTLGAVLDDLPEPGTDALIVQQPGDEGAILQALFTGDHPPRFDLICVMAGVRALYDGAWTSAQLQTFLEKHGYTVSLRSGDDPDRPCLVAQLDRAALALADLRAETISLRARLTDANAQQIETQRTLATLTRAQGERDERIVALTQAQSERDERIAALTQAQAEREAQLATLAQDRKKEQLTFRSELATASAEGVKAQSELGLLAASYEDTKKQIASLNEDLAARDRRINATLEGTKQANARVDALEKDLKAAQERSRNADTQITDLEQDLTTGNARIKDLESTLKTTRADLGAARSALSKLRDQLAMSEDEIADLVRQIATHDDHLKTAKIFEQDAAQAQAELSRMIEKHTLTEAQLTAQTQQTEQRDAQIGQLHENIKAAQELQGSQKADIIELRTRLKTALEDAAKRTKEAEQLKSDITTLKDAASQTAAQHKAGMDEIQSAHTQSVENLTRLGSEVKTLREIKAKGEKDIEDARTEHARLRSELQAARDAGVAASKLHAQNLETVQNELERSRRFQTALHVDLRDLQQRFAEQHREKQRQEDVLRQLTPRLQEAARHLDAIEAPQAPAAVEKAPVAKKPRAPRKKPATPKKAAPKKQPAKSERK